MSSFSSMDRAALLRHAEPLRARYDAIKARNLSLDMTRGKPCPEQLDLSLGMLELRDYRNADGTDCRNYGVLVGLDDAWRWLVEVTVDDMDDTQGGLECD